MIWNEKRVRLLIELYRLEKLKEESYVYKLARKCDITYSHVHKALHEFARLGLVRLEKVGRIKRIRLTDKGKEVARKLYEIETCLRG